MVRLLFEEHICILRTVAYHWVEAPERSLSHKYTGSIAGRYAQDASVLPLWTCHLLLSRHLTAEVDTQVAASTWQCSARCSRTICCCCSVAQPCLVLCDTMHCSLPGSSVSHYLQSLLEFISIEFSSVQLLSCVWLFATPRTTARQSSLSITNSWSLLKLKSIESVMISNQLILCCPLLPLPSAFPSIRGRFQRIGSLHQVAEVSELQLQQQSSQWIVRVGCL